MKRFSYIKQISIFVIVLSFGLAFNTHSSTKADATPPQTMTESKIAFNASSQVGVRETSTNFVAGKPYAQERVEWCGDFVRWVMQASGINLGANGRTGLATSYRVARAWAYYGPGGGGYGRWGTARDAMPGDILVDNYNGTASTGGHVSIVVETGLYGQPNLVRTVGGNESDSVKSEAKDTNVGGRYLITLAELRQQTVAMAGGGAVVFTRFQSGFGAIVKIHSIWAPEKIYYTPYDLKYNVYRLRARNAFTGATEYFTTDTTIASEYYRNVTLVKFNGLASITVMATLTHN